MKIRGEGTISNDMSCNEFKTYGTSDVRGNMKVKNYVVYGDSEVQGKAKVGEEIVNKAIVEDTINPPEQPNISIQPQYKDGALQAEKTVSNHELQQPGSTVKVLDKKQETVEQKHISQTIDATENPLEKRQGKLQKQSSKLLEHSNQEFQRQESSVQRVEEQSESSKQKQFSQTTSVLQSSQEIGQEKLQKQSSKQSQHVNQKIRKQDLIKDVKQPEILKPSKQLVLRLVLLILFYS